MRIPSVIILAGLLFSYEYVIPLSALFNAHHMYNPFINVDKTYEVKIKEYYSYRDR